jgi:hypothetical protein
MTDAAIKSALSAAIFAIVAVSIVAFILGPAKQKGPDFVPHDRIDPPRPGINRGCACGYNCRCDPCDCERQKSIVEPKILSVDPVTGYQATKPTIVMISRDWCGPCQQWKAGPMPGQIVAKGWELVYNTDAPARLFPTYRIFDGKDWRTVEGQLTSPKLRQAIDAQDVLESQPAEQRRIIQPRIGAGLLQRTQTRLACGDCQ